MNRPVKIALISVAVIAALAVAVVGWVAVGAKRDLNLANQVCRDSVTAHAKYESGVQFIDGTEDESDTTSTQGLISYVVRGEVDMVNGFGTPVRHTYWCHVGVNNGDTGSPEVTVQEK